MRVLILSCNTGHGHNSASGAIKEVLEEMGVYCEIRDALSYISKDISRMMSDGHALMYRRFPWLFSFGYEIAGQYENQIFRDRSVVYKFLTKGASGIYDTVLQGKFDVILCAHVFSALMMTEVKKQFPLRAKTYFVSTDYTCSPSMGESRLDGYFIPDPSLSEEFMQNGVPEDRLIPVGIPVRRMFAQKTDKTDAKCRMGIPKDASHAVMMCGSMGCGPMEELAEHLAEAFSETEHLTVVCGTNEKLYRKFSERFSSRQNIHIRGYETHMSLLMDSADIYITKPGGISVSEAAFKQIPMVLIDAVAGCEDRNMAYFVSLGGAVCADSVELLPNICTDLLRNASRQQAMVLALSRHSNINPAEKICSFLISSEK